MIINGFANNFPIFARVRGVLVKLLRVFNNNAMINQLWKYGIILLLGGLLYGLVFIFEPTIAEYTIPLSKHGYSRIPLSLAVLVISLCFVGLVIMVRMKGKKYLLQHGFVETKAVIVAVEKREVLGNPRKPKQRIVEFVLTVQVHDDSGLPFNAIITTRCNSDESFDANNHIKKRDYQVGEEIVVFYHPQNHTKVEYIQ